jgi:hypothetical protein
MIIAYGPDTTKMALTNIHVSIKAEATMKRPRLIGGEYQNAS